MLIEVVEGAGAFSPGGWADWSIEACTVISGKEGVTGSAPYDHEYGGFLDHTNAPMIPLPVF